MTQHKIALVSAFPPSQNSLNEYGFHLAKSFAERDDVCEVVIIADTLPEPISELDLGPKIRVERVWSFNGLTTPLAIWRSVKKEKPHLTLFNLHMASFGDWEVPAALGLLSPFLAKSGKRVTGVLAHNLFLGVDLEQTNIKGRPIRQAITRFGGNLMTDLLMRTDYLSVTLGSYLDTLNHTHPRANVHLVPHGTFDKPQETTPYLERPQTIITMGKFGTYKKLETLIKAFCKIKPKGSSDGLNLVIGGTDHPAAAGYIDALKQKYQSRKDIEFRGYIAEEDVAGFFNSARLCVFDYESTTGSSGVLHQAASFGTPPIFPRIGDFVDLCEDEGLTGLHYLPRDAHAMANAMRAILEQPIVGEKIAKQNYDAAHAFPIAKVAEFHIGQINKRSASKMKATAELTYQ